MKRTSDQSPAPAFDDEMPAERADETYSSAVLVELRERVRRPDASEELKLWFGKALLQAHYSGRLTNDTQNADQLLRELRQFADTSDLPAVRNCAATALLSAYVFTDDGLTLEPVMRLREEHRALNQPLDWDGLGLMLRLTYSVGPPDEREDEIAARRAKRLRQLRLLAADPGVPEVLREWWAEALVEANRNAPGPTEAMGLLDELRTLSAREGASDKIVQHFVIVLTDACIEATASDRVRLFEELRSLGDERAVARVHDNDARRLINAHYELDDISRKAACLLEAQRTVANNTEPSDTKDYLAQVMHRVAWQARSQENDEVADKLLQALRVLADEEHASDAVLANLAGALGVTYLVAFYENSFTTADPILSELRALVDRKRTRSVLNELRSVAGWGPPDSELWEVAARALQAAYRDACQAGDPEAAARWIKGLKTVARRRGATDTLKQWVAEALASADEESADAR